MTAEYLVAPPLGSSSIPRFDNGWVNGSTGRDPFLTYARELASVNWSEELEALHEESSRDHFIDVWTRRAILTRLRGLPPKAVIADVGCSTGHLLSDLRIARPEAELVGVDLVASGLTKAHALVPSAQLFQADAGRLPFGDASIDGVVSANLLEHVVDDVGVLAELYRVLRPGANAVIAVPAGPGTYDYYDRFLGHVRRYARGELAAKARRARFEIVEDAYLGSLIYPAFWLVKKRNRLLRRALDGTALEARVASDIARTRSSRFGDLACGAEQRLVGAGLRMPFGVRAITVLRHPERPSV